MKATDLMIGDRVKTPYGVFRITAIQDNDVVETDYIGRIGCDSLFEIENIAPIPITPEILEKNGWQKFQTYYRHDIDGFQYQYLEWYQHESRLQRLYIHKDNSREVVFTASGLSYVHQFQHALKLCGIDKEITL